MYFFPHNKDFLSTFFFYELKMEKTDIIRVFSDKMLQFSGTLLRKFTEKLQNLILCQQHSLLKVPILQLALVLRPYHFSNH